MAMRNQVDPELKLRAVREYLDGTGSLNKIAEKYGVCHSTLQKWLLNYELFGEAGLQHRIQNQHYPEALKCEAVEAYLPEQLSTASNAEKTIKWQRPGSVAPTSRFTAGCGPIMREDWRDCAVRIKSLKRSSLRS